MRCMSSRVDEKAEAREAREQAEAADVAKVARVRRARVLGGVVLLALLVVVVAIAVGGGDDTSKRAKGSGDVAALFAGIPQKGMTLGKASAPVTVEEFIDPQCPFCAQFSREALPTVIEDYVRTGKVKLVLRPLAFIGDDSVRAARVVAAASQQNQAWTYLDAFYSRQGPENSGYVTDAFLRDVGADVPQLDVGRALERAQTDDAVTELLAQAQSRATALGADSTPTLMASSGGGKPTPIEVDAADYTGSVTKALDALTAQ
jgi:protein-disulfide isomerase